jgi:integrase
VLGVETGLRISELLSIKFADVFDSSGRVRDWLTIDKAHCKGGKKRRELPLSPKAKDAIHRATEEAFALGRSRPEDYLFSPDSRLGAISRIHAHTIVSTALKKAGVVHTRGTHTARKTYAALLLARAEKAYQAGEIRVFPLLAVQLGLGHAELATTQHYLESGVEDVNKLIREGLS